MHEAVPPPIPLNTSTTPDVGGPAQQRHWLTVIARMRQQPSADQSELSEIESHIVHGVSLPLISDPTPTAYTNTPTVLQHADDVRKRLHEYMQFGAVVRLPANADTADATLRVQPLHVILKEGKKPRLVIDLSRNLNDHLRYEYFTYSSVDDAVEASHPGCWYGKLDLSNCFLSFPLHPDVRRYFCFRFESELYQFTHMPFGLSTAPRVCTQLLSVVNFALAELGIRDIRYLDDFFLVAATSEEMARHLQLAQAAIRQFGLVVNPDKTEGPAQSLAFLGVQLDSVAQTVSCTPQRVGELTALLRSLLRQRVITRAHAASLIGKLSFAAQVLPGARPFMRRMLDALHRCKSRRHSTPIRIDPGFRDDLRFWAQQLHHWNGRQQWRSSRAAPFVFASDASLRGFGFYLESAPTLPASTVDSAAWPQHLRVGATFSGTYAPEHAHLHHSHTQIAWCELLAVVACASTYGPLLHGQSLLFHVDNSTDVHIINRQATRSKVLAGLLRQLYSVALQYNLSIHARHRAGADNVLADFLSRPELHKNSHVTRWAATHPGSLASLSSVSLVSSSLYVSLSTASPATHSGSTHSSHTSLDSALSTPSVHRCVSTPTRRSQSNSSAACVSPTHSGIASRRSPASSPPSPTTPCAWASPNFHAAAHSTVSRPAYSTGTVTPTSVSPLAASLSPTCTPYAPTSTSRSSQTLATGVQRCSPFTACYASESIPARDCNGSTSHVTTGASASLSRSPRRRSFQRLSRSSNAATSSVRSPHTSRTDATYRPACAA